jgi:hypothetical protein
VTILVYATASLKHNQDAFSQQYINAVLPMLNGINTYVLSYLTEL